MEKIWVYSTILIICVYALNRNNHGKLYLPSTFQTLDIDLSPKRDHIYKLRFYMVEEEICLIITPFKAEI